MFRKNLTRGKQILSTLGSNEKSDFLFSKFFIFREKMEVVEKHLVEQFDMFSLGKDLLKGNVEETQVIHLDLSFSYSGIVNVLKGYFKKLIY